MSAAKVPTLGALAVAFAKAAGVPDPDTLSALRVTVGADRAEFITPQGVHRVALSDKATDPAE